jgi:hypothetical protein
MTDKYHTDAIHLADLGMVEVFRESIPVRQQRRPDLYDTIKKD